MKLMDEQYINAIRFLSVDAVEKAKSGHPGMPMGAAALAFVLWDRYLKHNPRDPGWPDRDRFVLSAGHASMLLYSLLYLTGYDLTLEDIKAFRQWGSKTPGHPEYGLTPGVEVTTGPLGQGFANGIGMAIAANHMEDRYNRPGYDIVNHYIYALVSDGDLEEGVASEAASLAGNLKLKRLIYLYDSNDVQQDGPTVSFKENVAQRFQSYGWNVFGPIDGMNVEMVSEAINKSQSMSDRPNLIICKTVIGYGSPHRAGTNAAHGEPLGEAEVRSTKENLKWPYEVPFTVPDEILSHFRKAVERGKLEQEKWRQKFNAYRKEYPVEAQRFEDEIHGKLPSEWDSGINDLFKGVSGQISTRDASGQIMNYIAGEVPSFMGGAGDLAGSTRAYLKGYGDFSSDNNSGRNIRFGLREHAMGAISNGLALHGGIIPFVGTFLIFSDYMRPSIRLASIMKLRVIYVFTHDSIGLGEDGPTHQPIEQLMGLRMVPDLITIRPADVAETVMAWKIAMEHRDGPVALVLTRQNVPVLDRSEVSSAVGVQQGGYILWEFGASPRVILIGTGSEVQIALEAGKLLKENGITVRVVSMPSWELFDVQQENYKNSVLPPQVKVRISIEAGTRIGWERYVGLEGKAIGLSRFGVSAPGQLIYHKFNLTSKHMVDEALRLL